ncbi:hypothetical protein [Streptomyces sp. NPDC050535]|uniref:hypothetical protein n=1 Tax=Streptomyces sp. NPDC050535 TaxID=3365626 RepID=UPI0037A51D0C
MVAPDSCEQDLSASLLGRRFLLFWRGSTAWFNLRQCLVAAGLGVAWLVQRLDEAEAVGIPDPLHGALIFGLNPDTA